jgi:hypothetical protein
VADAGPDALLFDDEGEAAPGDGIISVTLDGSDSADPFGGEIISHEWFRGDWTGTCDEIPAEPDFTEPLAAYDLTTGPGRTIYDFTLRVFDDEDNADCDAVEVIASHDLPPAVAAVTDPPLFPGRTPTVHLVDFDGDGVETFELEGSCSDPEGNLATCSWELDPGLTLDPAGAPAGTLTVQVETVLEEERPDLILRATDAPYGYMAEMTIDAQVEALIDDPESNDRPECRNAAFTMLKGTTLVIDPTHPGERLCQDPDDIDLDLAYQVSTNARFGEATGGPDLTYVPQEGFTGTDSFVYRGVDPAGARSNRVFVAVAVVEELQGTVHVGDLDGRTFGRPIHRRAPGAVFAITVLDGNDAPAPGALVSYDLDGAPGTCTTGPNGRCLTPLLRLRSAATLTVTEVSDGAAIYMPQENTDPDGDSDGTTIVLEPPARGR